MGVVAFKKPALGGSQYRDANPVPTSPLNNDLATLPLGPVSGPSFSLDDQITQTLVCQTIKYNYFISVAVNLIVSNEVYQQETQDCLFKLKLTVKSKLILKIKIYS